jgi:hypothetical protein
MVAIVLAVAGGCEGKEGLQSSFVAGAGGKRINWLAGS